MPIPPPPPPPPPPSTNSNVAAIISNINSNSNIPGRSRQPPPPPPPPSSTTNSTSPTTTTSSFSSISSTSSSQVNSNSNSPLRNSTFPLRSSSAFSTSPTSFKTPPPSHPAPTIPSSNLPPPPPGPAPVPPAKPARTSSQNYSRSIISANLSSSISNFSPPSYSAPLPPSHSAPLPPSFSPPLSPSSSIPLPPSFSAPLPPSSSPSSSPKKGDENENEEDNNNNNNEIESTDEEKKSLKEIYLEKRFYIIQEMITTEETYLLKLESLINNVILPLKSLKILEQNDFDDQFLSIINIYDIHKKFSFSDTSSRNLTFVNLIDELIKNLDIYSNYLAYFDPNMTRRGHLLTYNKKFAEFIENLNKNPPKYYDNLESLMIQPVQRIPRYRLLIQELLKYTPKDHPDYEVASDALEKVMKLAKYYNEAVRKRENKTKLMSIMMSLDSSNRVDLLENSDNRWVLKEGVILRQCRRKHKEFFFWLLSDQLLYGEKNPLGGYSLNRQIPFERCAVRDPFVKKNNESSPTAASLPSNEDNNTLTSTNNGIDNDEFDLIFESTIKSFRLRFSNKQEKAQWKYAMTKALENFRKIKLKQKDSEGGDGQENDEHVENLDGIGTSYFQVDDIVIGEEDMSLAPLWKPDSESPYCDLCSSQFSLISRRHHCRNCGKLVCQPCSSRRFYLSHVDIKKAVRVCDPCFETLSTSSTSNKVDENESDQYESSSSVVDDFNNKLSINTSSPSSSSTSPIPPTRKLSLFRGIATFLTNTTPTNSNPSTQTDFNNNN